MAEYTFKNERGEVKLLAYRMGEAPPYGAAVVVGGEEYRRCIDPPRTATLRDHSFISRSLPRWDADAPRHDSVGRPCFGAKHEVTEYVARKEGDWTYAEL